MIKVAVLTVSDSAALGKRDDLSGPGLVRACNEAGWEVPATNIVPDEEASIAEQLREWSDSSTVNVILTTGGTGVALRDVTPEATRKVFDREIPGIAELMRASGLEQTKFSVLSRGLAGTRKQCLIVNLPGSPAGAVHSLMAIRHLIPHVVKLLMGNTEH
jgi:molybdopterin adenylyltransferase